MLAMRTPHQSCSCASIPPALTSPRISILLFPGLRTCTALALVCYGRCCNAWWTPTVHLPSPSGVHPACRAQANGAASMGKYKMDANGRSLGHTDSLHEKDYKY